MMTVNSRRWWLLASFSLLMLVSSIALIRSAHADEQIRVTIVFDGAGHRVEQLYRPANPSPALPRSVDESRVRTRPLNSGLPVISWYSEVGTLVLQSSITDPRIRHVPVLGSVGHDNPVQYALQTSGVYLIAGPAIARRVIISLPSLNTGHVQLTAEQWTLDLTVFP